MICQQCELGFVEKYHEKLEDLYGDIYYRSPDGGVGYEDYVSIGPSYFIWAISLVALTKKKGSIFDLGCSNGLFLDLAKRYGFEKLCGNEYNSNFAAICRDKGYSVYDGSFLETDIEEETFDVVTAWAVIEHIPEIKQVFRKIRSIMKDDSLFFFEVPCLVFDENADKHWFDSSLEHIYYFTEKSFKKIVNSYFGQDYIGRVVNFSEFGSTIMGFVSKTPVDRYSKLNKYLSEINRDDVKEIGHEDLIHYFAIYSRYIEGDLPQQNVSEIIADHIGKNISNDSALTDYTIYDIFEKAKARRYFQQRFFHSEQGLHETEGRLHETEGRLHETEGRLHETEGRLHETEGRLHVAESKLRETGNRLYEIEGRLQAFMDSKTYRLMIAYGEALRSLKGFMLFPLRVLWVLLPTKIKTAMELIWKKRETKAGRVVTVKNPEWPAGRPLISVIIPCFNYGQYVEEAINSVLNQTFQNFEIIVVDGGSNDTSTIKKLRLLNKPKTMIYYRKERHLAGDNRNFGIKKAKGKYICCLDADDALKPTYLEKALFLAETYHYDIVYPSVQCFGDNNDIWTVNPVNFLSCADGDSISTIALFKKEAWKKVRGYRDWGLGDAHVPEDWEFWTRLLGYGYRAKRVAEPLMLYRVHGAGLTSRNRKSFDEQKRIIRETNERFFKEKNLRMLAELDTLRYSVENPFVNLTCRETNQRRILFALPFMITGGADTVLLQIAKYLGLNKFQVSCITTLALNEEWGDNSPRYEALTREVYHLYKFLEPENWEDFIFYLMEGKRVDLILITGCEFIYHMLPGIKERFPGVKVVDQLFNEIGHLQNNRVYADYIDLTIVANTTIKKILIDQYGERKNKVKVIVHGVDVHEEFNPDFVKKFSVFPPDVLPDNKFIVGYYGRFSEEKCPYTFVHIMDALKGIDDMFFLMIGNGPDYPKIRQQIESGGFAHKVYAPGFVDDVRPFLLKTNVVVIPSNIEGLPIILLEGLAMGIPVVASGIGGIPSVITDFYNGFLCDPNDVGSFTEKIRLLYEDGILRKTMSENARLFAEQKLDISKMNEEYLRVFRNLVPNRE